MSQVNNENQDFNWVKARQDCSVGIEFSCLHRVVEKNTEERQKGLASQKLGARLEFKSNDHEFVVHRTGNGKSSFVAFTLQKGSIAVKKSSPGESLELTLTFTDAGKCRFQVDGEGQYLHWQVARKALEEIFFYGLFEKESQ